MLKVFLSDLVHNKFVNDSSIPIPLSLGYVKSYALDNARFPTKINLFKDPENFVKSVLKEKPDVVGFANYGWNYELNKRTGEFLKSKLENSVIFLAGGPNIDEDSRLIKEYFEDNSFLDFYISDGGEKPFSELLECISNKDFSKLPNNIIKLENGNIIQTEKNKLVKNINDISSPYLSGVLDEFLVLNMIPLFESNRGCPFKCTFCAWGSASKNLVGRMPLDITIEEIRYVGKRSKANNWIFCDANFGMLDRDIEIAKEIRKTKDKYGYPNKCHMWLSKNTDERNVEIANILKDMVVPVMAVQSLDDKVLENIKRKNISSETYLKYQQKFKKIGQRTYSDLIVPLPGETIKTHLSGISKLFSYGVDIIQNHNMRLLPGAETNSIETRENFKFKTKYRLIHGDYGNYKFGEDFFKIIEYEESLRSTSSFKESELFYLRKIHFLIDLFWNLDVYKPILKLLNKYECDPLQFIKAFLENAEKKSKNLKNFFKEFDNESKEEWYSSKEEFFDFWQKDENFQKLENQQYEKINIKFSIEVLKEYKKDFDRTVLQILKNLPIPKKLAKSVYDLTVKSFPEFKIKKMKIDSNFKTNLSKFSPQEFGDDIYAESTKKREQLISVLNSSKLSISKILNTQGFSLRDLRMKMPEELNNLEFFFDPAN
ncbi:MAG: B12-binding domain-containing radical SAM protein [Pseudomonadota bacterium]|nr:B12-binding domain-containing radical SAM protein [Pseudomonadota bacterium]